VRTALLAPVALFAALAGTARADDASFGRIDGDLSVVAGAGVTVASRGPRGAVDMRLRYLDTAGVFVGYEEAPLFGSGAEPRRVFAGGLELRPLFLARWLNGKEGGPARVELALDSLGVELGVVLGQPQGGSFASRPGFETGLGFEVPVLAQASGPWIGLHGGVRWSNAALEGQPIVDANDRALYLTITVAWHQFFGAHVVDVGDTTPR